MFGFINLNKPAGFTSRDCVNIVSKNLGTRKVGHAGTLDPIAEGVLVIAVERATRLIEYVQEQPKTYRGVFILGKDSPSFDIETELIPVSASSSRMHSSECKIGKLADPPVSASSPKMHSYPECKLGKLADSPTLEQLQLACASMIGSIHQTPPAFSAVKINGQRAYDLARQGIDVEVPSRVVMIHSCEVVRYVYPKFELLVRCGSGTYIRSLGRDIAIAAGSCAVMESLCRESIGDFDLSKAASIDDFRGKEPRVDLLLPLAMSAGTLPRIVLSEAMIADLKNGKLVEVECRQANESRQAFQACINGERASSERMPTMETTSTLAVFDSIGNLHSIATLIEGNKLKPLKNL
jgi:tRNA pseudouridine55 synthase